MRVTDLSNWDYLGTYTVASIEPNGAVVLDKPFVGKQGDFIAAEAAILEVGLEVTAWRKRELLGLERKPN